MSVYIIEPSLTEELICSIFTSLVLWETKKLIGLDIELQEGCQTGYIECLADLLGESDDFDIELAFDKGETWLQVVASITEDEELSCLVQQLNENAASMGLGESDFDELETTVAEVVTEWISNNSELARRAIKNI